MPSLPRTRPRRLRRLAWSAVGLVALLVCGGPFFLDRYGRGRAPSGKYDAIVVLGARVWPGGKPSKALSRRTHRAVELWKEGLAPRLVLTGGVGEHPPSEARAAADLARSLGIPDSALVLEEDSKNTIENACFARQLLGPVRVLLVTDAYHVFRSERIFARYFPHVAAVGTPLGRLPPFPESLREVVALTGYVFFRSYLEKRCANYESDGARNAR